MFRRLTFAALTASAIVGALIGGAGAYSTYTSARWPNATATFYVNTGSVTDVSPSAAVSAIQTALNAWTTQSGSAIRLYYGGTTSANQLANDGVNAIFFRQASGGGIAANYTWWVGGNIVDSDVVFWDDRTFFTGTSGCTGGAYIEDIAAHELGHGIGLDHSSVADATMYAGYESCSQEFRTLASDDMAGARALYPGSGSSPPPPSNTAPTVSITSPADGASFPASTSLSLAASAFDSQDGSLNSQIQWTDNGTAIGNGGVVPVVLNVVGVHVLAARVTDSGGLQGSAQVSVTVTAAAPPARVNVAAASQGATASSSSSYSSTYPARAVTDGDRRGVNSFLWNDSTYGVYPDWVEIAFAGIRTINEVDVFAVQDVWTAPDEPTPWMTWSQWGLSDFTVQYWNGASWQAVPNGVVRGNNLVWKTVTFPALATNRIRVLVEGGTDGWSRLTEIEAYAADGTGTDTAPSVSITSPSSGTAAGAPASFTVRASATDAQGAVAKVAFYANGTLLGQDTTSPFSVAWNNVTAGSYTLTAVATDSGGLWAASADVNVRVSAGGSAKVNVAAASQGATASSSSDYSWVYPARAVIDGDRRGVNSAMWNDGTYGAYPDWVEIALAGSRTVDEVDVFTVQDAWTTPSEPTPSMTWSQWGVSNFTVEYWDGGSWQAVPYGTVRKNNLVWRTITFPPLTTNRIRVLVDWGNDDWSRLTEIEVYQAQ